jgi:HlyD family secretion protein
VDQCSIRAPVDGIVPEMPANQGRFLSLAVPEPLLRMAADNPLRVRAEIELRDLGRVCVSQRAAVTAEAFPNASIRAQVASISPEVTTRTIATAPAETRPREVVDVTLNVEHGGPALPIGLPVVVRFEACPKTRYGRRPGANRSWRGLTNRFDSGSWEIETHGVRADPGMAPRVGVFGMQVWRRQSRDLGAGRHRRLCVGCRAASWTDPTLERPGGGSLVNFAVFNNASSAGGPGRRRRELPRWTNRMRYTHGAFCAGTTRPCGSECSTRLPLSVTKGAPAGDNRNRAEAPSSPWLTGLRRRHPARATDPHT